MNIKISLAQMSLAFGDEDANFDKASSLIKEAAKKKSDLILLPELWASGYDLPNWQKYAVPLGTGIFSMLSDLARTRSIAIGSSLLEKKRNQAFNSFVLFGKDGSTLGVYRKVHRFRLLEEEKWLVAGDKLAAVDTPWGVTGLSICYDLRFPEIFRLYGMLQIKLILIVAEWPERRIAHWTKLLQARAIENQLFIAGVNKVGESQGVKLGGRSAVIDPWGEPVVEGDNAEGLFTCTIDLRTADKARRYIPVFKDRRPDIYDQGEALFE
jgi:predicted amidohydrolase